eukprot:CAMPEP_0204072700 /NCGR_PEP_ID=MMETSP0360-20130528/162147_1 /ASSEMBLY_ACC=CAM_ASM_000342 /TAXON_ID=268821 /ORGANISM="Scrippsiella Hangoei, Strain SHTV-5" /LENGTH=32 /DNA_ID= /DNA_START= /DNA_END= /DNA_ORIENTATION=
MPAMPIEERLRLSLPTLPPPSTVGRESGEKGL